MLILHDVGWPYGRRDLYYAPEQIPGEYRQPYAKKGMRPGNKALVPRGGLNPTMCNAETEGGPRNGVMTALDDFASEYELPLRRLFLPIYFGLAIVVEEERVRRSPELAAALERLESSEGRYDLMKVAEDVRLRAMLFQHNVVYQRSEQLERANARHLSLLKACLLGEHYLENEIRLELLSSASAQSRRTLEKLRDPVRHDQDAFRRLVRQRTGPPGPEDASALSFVPYTAMGRVQLDHLHRGLDAIRTDSVPGDLIECGTGRGGGAIFMRAYLDTWELADRRVFVADRFRSSDEPDTAPTMPAQGIAGFRADLNLVRDGFARFDVLDDRVTFLEGPMKATLTDAPIEQIALLRIGSGIRSDARAVLEALYDRVAIGGFVLVDPRSHPSVREHVDAYRAAQGITDPIERVDSAAIVWRKSAATSRAGRWPRRRMRQPVVGAPRPPLAPPIGADAIDLSVVVVLYNMRREAARTLQSLSRAYQEDVDDVDYEVIVVENGSSHDEKLGDAYVRGFGPEFRYLDLGSEATPSPAMALNQGIRAGRGRSFALMIDGAHVLTPGVLHFGLAGLRTYEPAIVATQQWYVGPGQQGDTMGNGYDEAYEDRLFEAIRWPSAGHRLFEIGHFVGDRDWLDGLWESNCMFVPRALLEQVGCFDESFQIAGGGYANLELYERLGTTPGVTVCTIMGEGSFHQVHGGTTTNQTDPEERRARVFGYGQEFAQLRGRPFKGPGKPIHYIGRIHGPAARRTKPRRMSAETFTAGATAGTNDGLPSAPTPVPDELKWAFTEAVWRSVPWTNTTWLGSTIATAPTDLLAYQELIFSLRPNWILEVGAGTGGRAQFLASICDLVGAGQVVSIDDNERLDRPEHPRLRYLNAEAHEPATVDAVRSLVGASAKVLVILGATSERRRTFEQFEAYAPMVPVGSYVIVADTIVNGHPVWPAFGPGPAEAVKQILAAHGDFVADPSLEKYSLTFNPGGFLRRVR